mmetsp:Transcript_8822/g.19024  ORF Transcript_8822/g.19024 Transcript_8822/m.19024 type:complete len:266 (-) Transcript_8822:239-1036(-)
MRRMGCRRWMGRRVSGRRSRTVRWRSPTSARCGHGLVRIRTSHANWSGWRRMVDLCSNHIQRFGSVGFRIALDFNVEPTQSHKLIHLHLGTDTLHLRHRLLRPPLHLGLVRTNVSLLRHATSAALVRSSTLIIICCGRGQRGGAARSQTSRRRRMGRTSMGCCRCRGCGTCRCSGVCRVDPRMMRMVRRTRRISRSGRRRRTAVMSAVMRRRRSHGSVRGRHPSRRRCSAGGRWRRLAFHFGTGGWWGMMSWGRTAAAAPAVGVL